MPRQRSQPVLTLTAAAKRINMREPKAKAALAKRNPWQQDAWSYFEIPEIKEVDVMSLFFWDRFVAANFWLLDRHHARPECWLVPYP